MRACRSCLIPVIFAAAAPLAQAQAPLLQAAGAAPADADLVVVVEDAAALRTGPFGAFAGRLLEITGNPANPIHNCDRGGDQDSFAESLTAWNALSQQLKLEPEAAFDKLLGRRVMLVVRDAADQAGPAEWAVSGSITRQVADRLRRNLCAAPRDLLGGCPVLALEHGRYQMVITDGADANSRLVLAPSHASSLFAQLAAVEKSQAGLLADTQALQKLAQFAETVNLDAPPQLLVLVRLDCQATLAGGADPPPFAQLRAQAGVNEHRSLDASDWLALVGAVDMEVNGGGKLRFAFIEHMQALRPYLAEAPAWSAGMFEELCEGSALTMIISGAALQAQPVAVLGMPQLAALNMVQSKLGGMPERLAMVVRVADNGLPQLICGLEASQGQALPARGDELIDWALGDLFEDGACWEMPPHDVADEAMRRVDLNKLGVPWESMCWTYRASPRAAGATAGGRAWWALGIGSSEVVEHVAEVLSGDYLDLDTSRWIELVDVHPAELVKSLKALELPGLPGSLAVFQAIEHVQWRSFAHEGGLLLGVGSMTMADADSTAAESASAP